jgi:hypothetical protein
MIKMCHDEWAGLGTMSMLSMKKIGIFFSKCFDIGIRRKYKPQYEALQALWEAYGVCITNPQSLNSGH